MLHLEYIAGADVTRRAIDVVRLRSRHLIQLQTFLAVHKRITRRRLQLPDASQSRRLQCDTDQYQGNRKLVIYRAVLISNNLVLRQVVSFMTFDICSDTGSLYCFVNDVPFATGDETCHKHKHERETKGIDVSLFVCILKVPA